jgi:midasin (ATPase involved in ribosome maturation)
VSKLDLLNQILEALFEVDHCEPVELIERKKVFDDLLSEAAKFDPSVSRDDLLRAIRDPYRIYRAQRIKKAAKVGLAP